MATCPRVTVVPDGQAFQPSAMAVKAVADSTEPRPRRSRANYNVKDCSKNHLQFYAPKRRSDNKKEVPPTGQKTEDDTLQKMKLNQQQILTAAAKKIPEKKERKRKVPKVTGLKQKRPMTRDSTSEEEQPVEARDGSSFSNDSNQTNGSRDRLLMRQWLEMEANRGNIPGLRWFDKNEKLIQITWRHGSRTEWSTSDVVVFKCWAQHTGRYDGKSQDYKRWKANFRCALNSLQDVKEVAEKRSTKPHDPYKVYRLLPAIPPKKRRRESVKSTNSSSAESTCTLTTEEAIQMDGGVVASEPASSVEASTQDLFLNLMPNSFARDQMFFWSALDPPIDAVETLESMDEPAMAHLDHCYADMEPVSQLKFQSLPSPVSPAPFNDAIPVPVQDLIESSEEFQTMVTAGGEDMPTSVELASSCDLDLCAELNTVQANTISSTNDNNIESILQGILNFSAFPASFVIAAFDQNMTGQTQ